MAVIENISFEAIRQALARRSGQAGIGQGPATPVLSQTGQPVGATPGGASPTATTPPPQLANPPQAQPQFSSPFAGPTAQAGQGFDEETRKVAKTLVSKLLQVL